MDISDETTAVIKKAEHAGFKTETREAQYEDDVTSISYVVFPAGKVERRINITSQERATSLLSIEFERFSFLADYEAIVDLKKGEIEAAITARESFGMSMLERRLGFTQSSMGFEDNDSEEVDEFALRAERSDGISVEISKCTKELAVLALRARARPPLSLKISLGGERTYASALSALEKISNSLFFQLDIERG